MSPLDLPSPALVTAAVGQQHHYGLVFLIGFLLLLFLVLKFRLRAQGQKDAADKARKSPARKPATSKRSARSAEAPTIIVPDSADWHRSSREVAADPRLMRGDNNLRSANPWD